MADIKIIVNNRDGLFSIQLDRYEWTGLTVNGEVIQPNFGQDIKFQYVQEKPLDEIEFEATANENIVLVNSGNDMHLLSEDEEETFFAQISYQVVNNEVKLHGKLNNFNFPFKKAQKGPILFSQGRMSGSFYLVAS